MRSYYLDMVKSLRGKQYHTPDGSVGRIFCDMLSAEIEKYNQGLQKSEREFLFIGLILQQKRYVNNGREIRELLKRRMDMCSKNQIKELLEEATRCDRQFPNSTSKKDDEQIMRLFNRLMLLGKVREANYIITKRSARGGILHPNDMANDKKGPLNKTVFEVLKEKHPQPKQLDEEVFVECDGLSVMTDVDINTNLIEKVAIRLRGSGGPSGTDSDWRNLLLRYGARSKRLREAVAASVRRHANEVIEWDHMRAFLARRGVALDKNPGTRPVGISEVRQRIEAKAMVMETGIDPQEVVGDDNSCAGLKAGIEGSVHWTRIYGIEMMLKENLLLLLQMHLMQCIGKPLCGMLGYYGQDVLAFFLIHIKVTLKFF